MSKRKEKINEAVRGALSGKGTEMTPSSENIIEMMAMAPARGLSKVLGKLDAHARKMREEGRKKRAAQRAAKKSKASSQKKRPAIKLYRKVNPID